MDAQGGGEEQLPAVVKAADMGPLVLEHIVQLFGVLRIQVPRQQNHRLPDAVGQRGIQPVQLPDGVASAERMQLFPPENRVIFEPQGLPESPHPPQIAKGKVTCQCDGSCRPNGCQQHGVLGIGFLFRCGCGYCSRHGGCVLRFGKGLLWWICVRLGCLCGGQHFLLPVPLYHFRNGGSVQHGIHTGSGGHRHRNQQPQQHHNPEQPQCPLGKAVQQHRPQQRNDSDHHTSGEAHLKQGHGHRPFPLTPFLPQCLSTPEFAAETAFFAPAAPQTAYRRSHRRACR